jgi:hypothetical protein
MTKKPCTAALLKVGNAPKFQYMYANVDGEKLRRMLG